MQQKSNLAAKEKMHYTTKDFQDKLEEIAAQLDTNATSARHTAKIGEIFYQGNSIMEVVTENGAAARVTSRGNGTTAEQMDTLNTFLEGVQYVVKKTRNAAKI